MCVYLEALAVEEELKEGEHAKRDAAPQEIGQQEELGELDGGVGLLVYICLVMMMSFVTWKRRNSHRHTMMTFQWTQIS